MKDEVIELAIIINSYNRLDLLRKSLASICNEAERAGSNYAVIIFDANSTDGSIEWINTFKAQYKDITIKLMIAIGAEPNSFSYGVNAACDYAIKKYTGLKNLFLYETDNFISSFKPLIDSQTLLEENKSLGACGFTVKKYDGKSAGYGCTFPTILSLILGQQLSFFFKLNIPRPTWQAKGFSEFSYMDVVYTSPLLIKKEVWVKVKGFDDVRFPFSDCDIDLAYRIKIEGYQMAVIKTSDVIHDNLQNASSWSEKRTINFYEARLAYFKKHFGRWINLLKPLLLLTHLLELFILFFLLISGKRKIHALKTRLILIKSVFGDYKL